MNKMVAVYTGESPPETFSKSLFLAGPSPRKPADPNWRTEAISLLERLGFDGVVFAPTYRSQPPDTFDYEAQVGWETKWLNASDLVVFWVPRDLDTLPGFTTNVEYGMWLRSGKVLLGSPPEAEKMTYLNWWADREGVERFEDLTELLTRAVETLSEGAERTGGERDIPLHLWKKKEFQAWYQALRSVGNRIEGAELKWAFRVGPKKTTTMFWALWVDVWIQEEKRRKSNEVVIFRPETASIVAYCRPPLSTENDWNLDSEVLLVREFRSPGANEDGMVHEVPGGSSWKPENPREVAGKELQEETGLSVDPERLNYLGFRQVAATTLGHRAHCFALELTPEEMLEMKWQSHSESFGNASETEITYLEVRSLRLILHDKDVDWSNLGMIVQAIVGGSKD